MCGFATDSPPPTLETLERAIEKSTGTPIEVLRRRSLAEVLENLFWSLLADHVKDLGPLEPPPKESRKTVWERLDEEL